jgi:hypothetical protein
MSKKILSPNYYRRSLSFPKFTCLLGYIIHLEATDEYLHESNGPILLWSKDPSMSIIFPSRGKAEKLIQSIKKEVIPCYLFENDDGLIVARVYE